jgi:hypothetical protein
MKRIIISIVLSLIAIVVMAQTNYYPNITGTITKSGYSYKYRNFKLASGKEQPNILFLYNSSVLFLDKPVANKDGTPLTEREELRGSPYPLFSGQSMTDEQVDAMIMGKFSSAQKATLTGKSFIVDAMIDTSTGKVSDVYFIFFRNYPFVNIPVETYRSIELALKEKFTVTVTAEGRRKNYIRFHWSPDF